MEEFDSSLQTEFSVLIDRLNPILTEIKDSFDLQESSAIRTAIDSIETDYNLARSAIHTQSSPAKHIERLAQNLGRSLGLVLFASHEAPIYNRQKVEELCREMMNIRFESCSDTESHDTTEIELEEDSVQKESRIVTVDDAVMEIKYGNEERFEEALSLLNAFVMDGVECDEQVFDDEVVRLLSSRFISCQGSQRATIVRILKHLTTQSDRHKERMEDPEFLSALVKSLSRDAAEQREAVGLLLGLSEDASVRRRIGRIQGCIVMLVAISNGDDQKASQDARVLLNNMSTNTQHAMHMAEAGYFKPLIKYLKDGSEMSKVLMATTLSRLELTDLNKDSLGQDGAIEPLVNMFEAGNLEAKLSALNTLQILSNSKQNIQRVIDTGIVVSLLQLLFSVTSVLMTLREPASAILAKVAQSESILVRKDVAQQMLSLLNLSSPIIQNHLLEALNNIVSHASASNVRKKMKENGVIQFLVPLFTERDTKTRSGALKLVYTLSGDMQGELMEQLGYSHVTTIVNVVSTSTSECEKSAALGILSNLPITDRKITDILKKSNLLSLMTSTVSSTPTAMFLHDSIARILVRFTVPSDRRLQLHSAASGVIPLLIKLLSSSSEKAKCNAALCLSQLSQNSRHLAKSGRLKWLCAPPPVDSLCPVHDGYCTAKGTFCLLKAGAVIPLVRALEGPERGADEAVLSCLSTLVQDEMWEGGCKHLAKACGVQPIIKVLTQGSLESQEKALWILERMFRVEDHREKYGECAQGVLIDLAQNGDPTLAPLVGKLLAHLQLLLDQSSYF